MRRRRPTQRYASVNASRPSSYTYDPNTGCDKDPAFAWLEATDQDPLPRFDADPPRLRQATGRQVQDRVVAARHDPER